MTLRQLINEVLDSGKFFKVVTTLKDHHYSDMSEEDVEYISHSYMSVIDELLEKPPDESTDRLVVSEKVDDLSDPPEEYIDTLITNSDGTDRRAIDFVPWSSLIDLEVDSDLKLQTSALLAHILWEITFYGYTENKVKEEREELQELIDRVDRGEEKLIPFEFDKVFKEPDE